jgi:hypothetical protein
MASAFLDEMQARIRALRAERNTLRNQVASHAWAVHDAQLVKWLIAESQQFQRSVNAMNDANRKSEEAMAQQLNDFDELGEYLKHAMELEQIAIREASLHEAYLNATIERLKAKKKELGLPD